MPEPPHLVPLNAEKQRVYSELCAESALLQTPTDPPVDLPPHHSFTREQDPKVLELLHLGRDLIPDQESALHPFPSEDYGLGFGGADSHLGRFTLGGKLIQ